MNQDIVVIVGIYFLKIGRSAVTKIYILNIFLKGKRN